MAKQKQPQLITKNGSALTLDVDPMEGAYLNWSVGSGYMYGVQENTAALRRFLRTVLRHLDKDKKRKRKPSRQGSMKATKELVSIAQPK